MPNKDFESRRAPSTAGQLRRGRKAQNVIHSIRCVPRLLTNNTSPPAPQLISILVVKSYQMSFQTKATIASFGGKLLKLTHEAQTTGCEMALNLYLPPSAGKTSNKVPVLFYLAGLTCTGDNGAEKGFFQYGASQKGIAVVYPDTSPRTKPHMLLLPLSAA